MSTVLVPISGCFNVCHFASSPGHFVPLNGRITSSVLNKTAGLQVTDFHLTDTDQRISVICRGVARNLYWVRGQEARRRDQDPKGVEGWGMGVPTPPP